MPVFVQKIKTEIEKSANDFYWQENFMVLLYTYGLEIQEKSTENQKKLEFQ